MHIKDLIQIFSIFSLIMASSVWAQNKAEDSATAETNQHSAEADSTKSNYHCELRGNVRRVEIQYADTTSPLPCSVLYYKDTEAPETERELWSATNEEGYCEAQAQEFVEKLQNWGWGCK